MELIDAKTIVRKNTLNYNYLAAEYAMDLYHGCSHGCIYCYARSSYYRIEEFDRVRAKKNALQIVRDELRRKVKNGIILTASMSDPYNPQEEKERLFRNCLELINAFEFGISVITKSDLVLRDIDILQDIKEHSPVSINFSITCSDDELCGKVEPYAPKSSQRFKAISKLAENGIFTGVLMDPIIPYITDTEENVRDMVKKAKAAGADYIYASMAVTMAGIQRDYFYEAADRLFPGISDKYRERYKNYYHCRCPKLKKLWNSYVDECEKQGIMYDMQAVNARLRAGYNISELQMRLD